tara:strand:+ start:801 stop:971 length:171 start_codon:yes stop_codon:yes gene_type:complete
VGDVISLFLFLFCFFYYVCILAILFLSYNKPEQGIEKYENSSSHVMKDIINKYYFY